MGLREDARKMKALTDENRLAIMLALQHGEKCGCVLLEELNITQPTLSHHMKILCDSDLVSGRKEGKWMYYSISPEGVSAFRKMVAGYARCDCEAVREDSRSQDSKSEDSRNQDSRNVNAADEENNSCSCNAAV